MSLGEFKLGDGPEEDLSSLNGDYSYVSASAAVPPPSIGGRPTSVSSAGLPNKDFKMTWRKVADSQAKPHPGPRTYFTMAAHNELLWLFGGFGDSKERFNDVFCYNPVTRNWRKQIVSGDVPKPIYLHSTVVYNGFMYVFGGSDGHDSNRFNRLSFATNTWTSVAQAGQVPSPRYGHAAVAHRNKMYVVAGCRKTNQYLQDAYEFDFATGRWRDLPSLEIDMAYHSLFAVNGILYLFGGYNGTRFVEDLFMLDVSSANAPAATGGWRAVPCTGAKPDPRCGCSLALLRDMVYVFGGYTKTGHTKNMNQLNIRTKEWRELPVSGDSPMKRAYLQSAVLDDPNTKQPILFLYGGYDGAKCVTDFFQAALGPPPPSIGSAIHDLDISSQVEYALAHFDEDGDGKLSAAELSSLFENLRTTMPKSVARAAQPDYPFDTSAVPDIMKLGFEREAVLKCMSTLHKEGQDATNVNLVVDRLINMPQPTPTGPVTQRADPLSIFDMPVPLAQPELSRDKSERSELRERLSQAIEEKNDLKSCKVCFEAVMDCVLQRCGHLAVCQKCADDLKKKNHPCPICRKPITGRIAVFWG